MTGGGTSGEIEVDEIGLGTTVDDVGSGVFGVGSVVADVAVVVVVTGRSSWASFGFTKRK